MSNYRIEILQADSSPALDDTISGSGRYRLVSFTLLVTDLTTGQKQYQQLMSRFPEPAKEDIDGALEDLARRTKAEREGE